MAFTAFDKDLLAFLRDLRENNNRAWFQRNKDRYEESVREPMLAFIEVIGPKLATISPHIVADPRKVGGSLFRINRDTRFSSDKRPYKENVAAQFRHAAGKNVHAPGFYIHIDPGEVRLGTGIWQPETQALAKIREAIDRDGSAWKQATRGKAFRDCYGELAGDSLKRAPRGFDADHPLVEDLKRKDFVAFRALTPSVITKRGFLDEAVKTYAASKGLMKFLCDALGLPF